MLSSRGKLLGGGALVLPKLVIALAVILTHESTPPWSGASGSLISYSSMMVSKAAAAALVSKAAPVSIVRGAAVASRRAPKKITARGRRSRDGTG